MSCLFQDGLGLFSLWGRRIFCFLSFRRVDQCCLLLPKAVCHKDQKGTCSEKHSHEMPNEFFNNLIELTLLFAGDVLLTPAKLYSPSLLPVLRSGHVKAFAFIAEEGLLEGISRVLPEHVSAVLGKYQR